MTKVPLRIMEHLSPTDALAILRSLAGSDDRLAARIAGMATARLRGVDPEEVAAALYDELDGSRRAGRTRKGLVSFLFLPLWRSPRTLDVFPQAVFSLATET